MCWFAGGMLGRLAGSQIPRGRTGWRPHWAQEWRDFRVQLATFRRETNQQLVWRNEQKKTFCEVKNHHKDWTFWKGTLQPLSYRNSSLHHCNCLLIPHSCRTCQVWNQRRWQWQHSTRTDYHEVPLLQSGQASFGRWILWNTRFVFFLLEMSFADLDQLSWAWILFLPWVRLIFGKASTLQQIAWRLITNDHN